jgi:hypothetical protein
MISDVRLYLSNGAKADIVVGRRRASKRLMHCSKETAEEPRAYFAGRQAERGQGVDLGRLSTRGDFNDSEETPRQQA